MSHNLSKIPQENPQPIAVKRVRDLSLVRIAAESAVETYRASGPGGQNKNKTSSAVRIVHQPTGLHAIAHESRSQQTNRRIALRRLQHRIALEIRQPIDIAAFSAPPWWGESVRNHQVQLNIRNPKYPEAIAMVLDVLATCGWSVSDAAAPLGLSTSGVVAFMRRDHLLWAAVNRNRTAAGLRVLNNS
jgi:hypothetical protein